MQKFALCLVVSCCALAACGGSEPVFVDHPSGWMKQPGADKGVWYEPKDPRQLYSASRTSDPTGTLRDAASQIATNELLRRKGSKLVRAVPFPPCPGEAGLQAFTVTSGSGPALLQVGFGVWKGEQTVVEYQRPAGAPDNPAAMDAMKSSLCS